MKKLVFIFFASILIMSYKPIEVHKKLCKVTGSIVDEKTKEMVLFCKVWLQNTSHKTTTDIDGNFLLDSIEAGKYTLCAFNLGYDTLKLEIQVNVGKKNKSDINLKRATVILGPDLLEDKMFRKN